MNYEHEHQNLNESISERIKRNPRLATLSYEIKQSITPVQRCLLDAFFAEMMSMDAADASGTTVHNDQPTPRQEVHQFAGMRPRVVIVAGPDFSEMPKADVATIVDRIFDKMKQPGGPANRG